MTRSADVVKETIDLDYQNGGRRGIALEDKVRKSHHARTPQITGTFVWNVGTRSQA